MNYFNYKKNKLFAEDVLIERISEKVPTPFYVYSKNTLIRHINAFKKAFSKVKPVISFALKSNSNFSILKIMKKQGIGADCVSFFEMKKALESGISPKKIILNGNGKTEEELEYALKKGILMINIDNKEELELLSKKANKLKKKAPVALRVNPEIDAQTHPHIATSLKESKFGFDMKEAKDIYLKAKNMKGIEIKGIHIHIGSQITKITPFIEALEKVENFVKDMNSEGIYFEYFNVGGGLGIVYNNEMPPNLKYYAESIISYCRNIAEKLILEPGRVIIGNAGILVTRILYIKKTKYRNFIVVDAGMHGLLRPTLYNAYHEIKPVDLVKSKGKKCIFDVVGPICESGDILGKDRRLPESLKRGDLLAIFSAGAYGYSMASNYNLRPLPAEVLVDRNTFKIIRRNQDYKDLRRLEID